MSFVTLSVNLKTSIFMRFFSMLLAMLTAGLATFNANAQLNPSWSVDLSGKLHWQRVMASGSYLVASDAGLSAYDQASGKQLWNNAELAGASEESVTELAGSPLLKVNHSEVISIIDPFSGTVRFNSKAQKFAEIQYQTFLPQSGIVIVAGKDSDGNPVIMAVDSATGDTRWTLNEKFGRIVSINEANANELIITTLFYVYKLNSGDGNTIWKNSITPGGDGAEDNPLGELLMDFAEVMTEGMDFVIRFYQNPKADAFVIASESKRQITMSDGKTQDVFSNSYQTFRLSSGKPIWGKEVQMQGKLGDVTFYNNGVILLPDDGNKTTINFYPLEADANGQWGKKGRGTNIKGGVYRHVPVKEGLLLISASGSTTFLDLLDPSTGELRFGKPIKIDGKVQRAMDVASGVLYITTEEANIVNPATGDQVLGKSIPTSAALTHIEGTTMFAYDLKFNGVKKIDLNTGSVSDMTPGKLKLEGKESATALEYRNGKLLVTSDQNLALFDENGALVYQAFHAPPKVSGLQKALLYAQAVRAAYIGANAYAASSALQTVETDDEVAGAMVSGIGMAYQEVGDQANDFVKKSIAQARERASATAQGRDFNIVLGATGKTNSLLKVNKDTGEAEASIDLGDDKDPKYAVDDVTGRIFLVNGKSLLMFQL